VQNQTSTLIKPGRSNTHSGFTLIELLVVFTLLALLLSIAVPRYLQTVETSREKVRQQNMATLRDALDKFKADQGRYPTELAEIVDKQYLRQIPADPVSGSTAWVPLPHPTGLETGVYDVAPPLAPSTPSVGLTAPANAASSAVVPK
jgi:general secretion pathway protein G